MTNERNRDEITLERLKTALGPGYAIEDFGDGLRIMHDGGGDIVWLNLDPPEFDCTLTCKFAGEPGPDSGIRENSDAEVAAITAINENLRELWENEGFTVDNSGYYSTYHYLTEPDRDRVLYMVEARKRIETLEEAVRTINAIVGLESQTFAQF